MKYIVKNKLIILVNKKENQRIIVNYNDDKNEMALNTFISIKKIIDNDVKNECYIVNINRYKTSNYTYISKLKIKNPNIKIFSINVIKYIDMIRNKQVVDLDEIDRMLIIFTSKNIGEIYKYIKSVDNFDKLIFSILK